ncbi:DUF2291 family protein [Pelagicoccus sp. NFK12]|uniref:DUF2291 family protein n=1 Tax=Pelagicoccus enzymogenes TaxID=2773457 RepID=A0A927IHN7_9BACT|nr:DUF2291 family protein [Pelagicoccus enzymogenes]MBD5782487.1 DUF2291 family protein [Pelagicoccus enzymogenes]
MNTVSKPSPATPKKWLRVGGTILVVAALWILFPPFGIVSLDEDGKIPSQSNAEVFDPTAFVETFWKGKLEPRFESATKVTVLVEALSDDLAGAVETYGIRQGDVGPAYFLTQGEATIVALKGRRATLAIGKSEVNLLIAPPVFGNTVRDGTGLLNLNDFPGLEEFNAVSATLNHKVETEVMQTLGGNLEVGTRLRFVGCGKAPSSLGDGPIAEFIPLFVEVVQ